MTACFSRLRPLALAAGLAFAASAQAAPAWTDWLFANDVAGMGLLNVDGSTVQVNVIGPILFAQTDAGATDFWTQGSPDPYAVTGRPTGSDIIAITGGDNSRYTIAFSQAVMNPVIALLSVGQGGAPVRYQFDQAPTLLSSGQGYWGGCDTCLTISGNTVTGVEGHGVVRFSGAVTQISFSVPDEEHWHGFTVGAMAAAVPEPETYALMLAGLGAVGFVARRRRPV